MRAGGGSVLVDTLLVLVGWAVRGVVWVLESDTSCGGGGACGGVVGNVVWVLVSDVSVDGGGGSDFSTHVTIPSS